MMDAAEPMLDVPELDRLVRNVEVLANRVDLQIAPPPELRRIKSSARIVEAVKWAFATRRQLLAVDVDPQNWRQSFSRLGPPSCGRDDFLISEYQRTEMTVTDVSPLGLFYPWIPEAASRSIVTRYTANGMSAVGAFLMGLARHARSIDAPINLISTPLYHETRQLLTGWMFDGAISVNEYSDEHTLLDAFKSAEGPHVLYLDSAEKIDTSALIAAIPVEPSENTIAIVWDNSCIPYDDPTALRPFPAPLYLLRSHLKLDQLGFEFGALGSVMIMAASASNAAGRNFLLEFLPRLPINTRLFGVNASGETLRRMAALQLPDRNLTPESNKAMRAATRLGVALLQSNEDLAKLGITLRTFPHECFCHLLLPVQNPESNGNLDYALGIAHELHDLAIESEVPLISCASFGFPFTSVTGFALPDLDCPTGLAQPILRVSFGSHDPDVTAAVVDVVCDGLTKILSRARTVASKA